MATTSSSGRPIEVELKYRVVDPAAGDRYLVADEIAGFTPSSPVRSSQVEDRYIDTADGALARAGFAARLRQTAKGTTVGVKSAVRRVNGNVHRREELEGPADRTAHPRDWPASDARSLILEQCGDAPLVEVVTIRQLRRKRLFRSNGTTVELSLDEVDAVARSRVVSRFVELEVELVTGREAALAPIDRALAADRGLQAADSSKLDRALSAIVAAEPRRAKRAGRALPPVDVDEIEADAAEGAETPAGAASPAETASPVGRGSPEVASGGPGGERPPATGVESTTGGPGANVESPTGTDRPAGGGAPQVVSGGAEGERPPATGGESPTAAHGAERPKPTRTEPSEGRHGRPKLVVGKTPGVLADDHLAEAGRKVLRFHLARMIAKEAGTRTGED